MNTTIGRTAHPRTYTATTEQIVLDRIAAGTLRIDTLRGRASVLYRGQWREATYYRCHRGYRWMRLHHRGARRAVGLHRAVWIASHKTLPPEGCEIHHTRGKIAGDGIGNLELLTREAHAEIHRRDYDDFMNS